MSQDKNENRRRQQLLKNAGYSVNIDGSWGPYQNKLWMHYLGNQVQQKNPSSSAAPTVIAIPGGAGAAARYAPQVVRYLQGLAATGAIAENFTNGSELGTASQLAPFAIGNWLKDLFSEIEEEEGNTSYNSGNNTPKDNPKKPFKERAKAVISKLKDLKQKYPKTNKVLKTVGIWQGVGAAGDVASDVINHWGEPFQFPLTKNVTPVGWIVKGAEALREKPTETPVEPKKYTPQWRQEQYWKQYENY